MTVVASVVQVGQISIANLIVAVGAAVIGFAAWRSQRGDFYKAVSQEKTAEAERLRHERDKWKAQTDITPILDRLDGVTAALERQTAASNEVFKKVADMNGALRHHAEAMQALGDRLILDEAARALLATAADRRENK